MKRDIHLILLCIFAFSHPIQAGDSNSILIEGKYIKIGTTKEEVRKLFPSHDYVVTEVEDKIAVSTYSSEHPRFVCIIYFDENKVKSISKQWTDYYVESGGLKSFQALFSLIANYVQEGYTYTQVSTSQVKQPNFTSEIIMLTFGNRKIEISINKNNDLTPDRFAVEIQEILSRE